MTKVQTNSQGRVYVTSGGKALLSSSGGVGIPREIVNGTYSLKTTDYTFTLPDNVTNIGDMALNYAFQSSRLTGIFFPAVTTINGSGACSYACNYCGGLVNVTFPVLSSISGYNALYRMFAYCSNLETITFTALSYIGNTTAIQGLCYGCEKIKDIYFNALTTNSFVNNDVFKNVLSYTGTSVTHTLHFPSNLESTIQVLTGYPTFGGTSGYVTLAFDLPATS